ncbi:MAG: eL32 family ribosomal protein, partial [Conexivisphaerales archaeon]
MKEKNQNKQLLRLRSEIAKKRPKFVRPESWRYKRLKRNWKKPKGIDNKVRLSQKGWPALVKVGYRGPKLARGLHPSGLFEKLVSNTSELAGLDPNVYAV